MKLFLDSALTDEIQYAIDWWNLDGITTNPKHIQVSGKPFLKAIEDVADIVAGLDIPVSVQTNPHNHGDWQAIVEEVKRLASMSPNFVVKMPCTEDGFRACAHLAAKGIRSNLTLCFSSAQALMAMRMGAYIVSPFIGWKEANGEETGSFIEECVAIKDNYGYETQILVAAIRNARQISEAAVRGADIVTCGFAVYKDMLTHPYTDMGLGKFQEFWDETPYGEKVAK